MLNGKVAVVTGGTRGIGYATVKKFLDEGAKVVLFGSKESSVAKALESLKNENNDYEVTGLYPDLSDIKSVEEAFDSIIKEYGKIDILVNNAGISARESLYDYTSEAFDNIIDLNIKAVFNCSKVVAPYMKENGGGVILNTSSMVSIYGQPSGVGYPTSKFAVNGMTKSLARELGKDNIRVNAVAPGVIRTDMVAALPEEMVKMVCAQIPLGRMGEPEDIANAFAFLASDSASFITGAILSVDGAGMC
ncbi:MAG: SDR family oxidoreductase [Bacilli bacterium]|mgnify:FL=1|nr:SDR family oxidoreductase [Bacilli bacterium]